MNTCLNIMIYYTRGRSKMNIFVLKAMRQIDNSELFTAKEMISNADDAYYAALHTNNAHASYVADVAVTESAYAAVEGADYWINKYFKETGEDKQLYINEVERLR